MSRILSVQTNFTTGELDPKLNARVDLQQYYNSLETAQNVVVQPQGGIKRREGTRYLSEIPGSEAVQPYTYTDFFTHYFAGNTEGIHGLFLSPDGTNLYWYHHDDTTYRYFREHPYIMQAELAVPFDIGSATIIGKTSSTLGIATSGNPSPQGFAFNDDGTKLYVTFSEDNFLDDILAIYTLTTAWDITTISPSYTSATTSSVTSKPSALSSYYYHGWEDLGYNSDGSKCFVIAGMGDTTSSGFIDDKLFFIELNLSPSNKYNPTADTSANDSYIELPVSARRFSFGNNGKTLYFNNGDIYTLTTAYDISTAQLSSDTSIPFSTVVGNFGNSTEPDSLGDIPNHFTDFIVTNDSAFLYYMTWPIGDSAYAENRSTLHAHKNRKFKMVPFEFSVDDSYMLVFSHAEMHVFKDGVSITTVSVPAVLHEHLDEINFTQAADSLILVHENMVPQFIQRGATDSSWTVQDLTFDYIPRYAFEYDTHNPTFTITPSAESGNITLTASSVTTDTGTAQAGSSNTITLKSATSFTSDDQPNGMFIEITSGTGSGQTRHVEDYVASTKVLTVYPAWDTAPDATSNYEVKAFKSAAVGEYINILNGFGRARITEYVSDTVVKAFVEIPFFDTDAIVSGDWESEHGYEDVWSTTRGWPRSCVFHEGRLFFGGSKSRPSTLWGSRVNDFFNFDPGEALDDASLEATLDTGKFNAIVDIYSGRNLQIFTTGGEFSIPQTLGDPITPSNLAVKEQTSNGVKPGIPVVNIDGATMFVQRGGKTISEFVYDDAVAGYVSTKISLLSSHLLKSPTSMASRKATSTEEGDRILITNEDDGSLVCFTLFRTEKIVAPTEWTTDGEFVAVGVDVTDTYAVAKRTIDGVATYYVELFDVNAKTDSAVINDSFLSSQSSASGLDHLEGETVNVLRDGVVETNKTVSSGAITFTTAATSSYQVGLPFTSTIKTMPYEPRLQSGPARTFKKRILEIIADLYETQGITIDGEAASFDVDANGVITPFTGFKKKGSLLGYTEDATITITQSQPVDMNLLSLDYKVSVGQ